MTEWFLVNVGFQWLSVMPPWLFDVCMDGVVREVNASVLERGL